MLSPIKKLIFTFTYNLCLFVLLIIGIQNSSSKSKVKLPTIESVQLPVGFIVGSSFISGSIIASLIRINFSNKKQ